MKEFKTISQFKNFAIMFEYLILKYKLVDMEKWNIKRYIFKQSLFDYNLSIL